MGRSIHELAIPVTNGAARVKSRAAYGGLAGLTGAAALGRWRGTIRAGEQFHIANQHVAQVSVGAFDRICAKSR